MVSGNVTGNRRYCEQLQGKIFDGSFCFAVNEQVGIDDSVVNVSKVPRCNVYQRKPKRKRKEENIPTDNLCALLIEITEA